MSSSGKGGKVPPEKGARKGSGRPSQKGGGGPSSTGKSRKSGKGDASESKGKGSDQKGGENVVAGAKGGDGFGKGGFPLADKPYAEELQALMKETALRPSDLDLRAYRLLDAYHERGKVGEVCEHLAKVVENVDRRKVNNWRAYVYTLLKGYDKEVYNNMKGAADDAGKKGGDTNWDLAAPPFVPGQPWAGALPSATTTTAMGIQGSYEAYAAAGGVLGAAVAGMNPNATYQQTYMAAGMVPGMPWAQPGGAAYGAVPQGTPAAAAPAANSNASGAAPQAKDAGAAGGAPPEVAQASAPPAANPQPANEGAGGTQPQPTAEGAPGALGEVNKDGKPCAMM